MLLKNKFLTDKLSNSLRRQEEEKMKQHFIYEEKEKTASIRVMGISERQKNKEEKMFKAIMKIYFLEIKLDKKALN